MLTGKETSTVVNSTKQQTAIIQIFAIKLYLTEHRNRKCKQLYKLKLVPLC